MAVGGLRGIVDESLVLRFQGLASGSGNSVTAALSGNSSKTSIADGLRVGAQTFASAVQGLNGAISFLNMANSNIGGLLKITDKMIDLAERSTKISTSSDARHTNQLEFRRLVKDFQEIVDTAKFGDRELLNVEEIEDLFRNLGLDKDQTDTIASVFKRFVTPNDDTNLASEEVKGDRPYSVPASAYVTSSGATLARSTAEYETIFDGTLDMETRPNAYKLLNDLEGMRKQLTDNQSAINNALDVVGKNMDLVRAAGFAFLELSNQITSEKDADSVAAELRQAIRANARGALAQAENLENIVVAALAFDIDSLTKSAS